MTLSGSVSPQADETLSWRAAIRRLEGDEELGAQVALLGLFLRLLDLMQLYARRKH